MRLSIGNVKTHKFEKLVEVICIDAHSCNDHILYIQDSSGSFITLVFPTREALKSAIKDAYMNGYATVFCDYEYYNYNPDFGNREIDPYGPEIMDIWGYEYGREN